jgi:hypothetical protein
MRLAVLFWFHKDVKVCVNRLQILQKYNPILKIYGLYGGNLHNEDLFKTNLSPFLDDFFAFKGNQDPSWKWLNGDLVINDWFRERGLTLVWDTITIIQADMVVIGNVPKIFKDIKEREILLSNTRPVEEVIGWWWRMKEPGEQQAYKDFYYYMVEELGYCYKPSCCQYVIVCLPKVFLEKYSKIENPELGFIEYRVPMYAQLFQIPFVKARQFDCWWRFDPDTVNVPLYNRPLTASKIQVRLRTFLWNLSRKSGSRIFHPFDNFFPISFQSSISCIQRIVKEASIKRVNRIKKIILRLVR